VSRPRGGGRDGSAVGSEHRNTLTSKGNFANTLAALGHFTAAREIQEQVVEIQERVLGSEHSSTLCSKTNLAHSLLALGDVGDAMKILEQVVEIQERLVGGKHPDTTFSTWTLLLVVRRLNDSDAEARLIAKLRWLLDSDEASILSATQRRIRQALLDDLLNPS
jgi:Tetratricopeptide repeat